MSNINALNKVDVKELALAGQRVIKVINNGVAEYHPVGLSSLNPNGGGSGSSIEFYECASDPSATGATGIKVSGTVEGLDSSYTNYDGNYILENPDSTGASRRFINEGVGKIIYDEIGPDLYAWLLLGDDDDENWTDLFTSSITNENASVADICDSDWSSARHYPDGDTYKFEEISGSSDGAAWSGYKMTWSDGDTGADPYSLNFNGTDNFNDLTLTCGESEVGSNRIFKNSSSYITMWWSGTYWEVGFHPDTGSYLQLCYIQASANATTAEMAEIGASGIGEIPRLSTIDTTLPAGWVKAETPTEGLIVNGYTPEIGEVYSQDTTVYGVLYPEEIPSGGSSESTTPTPGAANVVLYLKYKVGGTLYTEAYTPKDLTSTGTSRMWFATDNQENDCHTLRYFTNMWSVYSEAVGEILFTWEGSSSTVDPWKLDWESAVGAAYDSVSEVEFKVFVV